MSRQTNGIVFLYKMERVAGIEPASLAADAGAGERGLARRVVFVGWTVKLQQSSLCCGAPICPLH
ncbi:hypothetical protein BAE44_0023488 [Dichanthelium oligosanthes]|uniref:Uncharacterized protein n=1 Tax=Dichanthelium oligosanthes TaxID=888268 RepID=A0A1E5URK5_9POAL|nr:hypothetical protein BAE44_0023488 [Dichanthelium oligosanthes]